MSILQHYYTSFVNRTTGSAGFQTQASSPEITPTMEASFLHLITYRIPSTLDESALATHPVALRYLYRGPHESILLCSQSSGSDEYGRPGNFFAHTLLLDAEIFMGIPPIFYWSSPFWRNSSQGDDSILAPLSIFDIEPVLAVEDIWDFLSQGNRLQKFYALMCAVVHSGKTHRRIIIIDSADNVALWIAAVSSMLPPAYRPLLSFATYHHDPQHVPFLITGTTEGSLFHLTPETYVSYFILNAETGVTSNVQDSLYASLTTEAAHTELYEERMLPLFADYAQYFPIPTIIDEQLDALARYARLMTLSVPTELMREDMEAIRIVLSTFERMQIYSQEDRHELEQLQQVLQRANEQQSNLALSEQYTRLRIILQRL